MRVRQRRRGHPSVALFGLVFALAAGSDASLASAIAWPELGACGDPATPIHAVQGRGASSPWLGQPAVVEAVVVGDFPGSPEGLGGFFVQQENARADADPRTSEGLFVFDPSSAVAVQVGDGVRLLGEVREYFGLTELANLSAWRRCPPCGRVTPATLRLPVSRVGDLEAFEGMWVRLEQRLFATDLFAAVRFGEVDLAVGARPWAATQHDAPGDAARQRVANRARHRILLDDGTRLFLPDPVPWARTEQGPVLRLGDTVTGVEGVLDYAFGRFRIQPTRPARFRARRPRGRALPPAVAGTLRLAVWNLENFFNGDGRGGGFPTRGAATALEFERQLAKIVETLVRLDADLLALSELENDGSGPESALRTLVDALAARGERWRYRFVETGALPGPHAIAVGLLFRSQSVEALGPPALLDAAAHPDFDSQRNRPSLAQRFQHTATGEPFRVVVNHFKSKGSDCDAVGDPDLGDGQGDCNATRTRAARALVEWLKRDPTAAPSAPSGGGSAGHRENFASGPPVPMLVVGDLNAHPREDPLAVLAAAGFVDLVSWFAGPEASTTVFGGARGRLDHALASAAFLPKIGGVAVWNVNADASPLLGPSLDNPDEFYRADPQRASDHDPILIGLFPPDDGPALHPPVPSSAPGSR